MIAQQTHRGSVPAPCTSASSGLHIRPHSTPHTQHLHLHLHWSSCLPGCLVQSSTQHWPVGLSLLDARPPPRSQRQGPRHITTKTVAITHSTPRALRHSVLSEERYRHHFPKSQGSFRHNHIAVLARPSLASVAEPSTLAAHLHNSLIAHNHDDLPSGRSSTYSQPPQRVWRSAVIFTTSRALFSASLLVHTCAAAWRLQTLHDPSILRPASPTRHLPTC